MVKISKVVITIMSTYNTIDVSDMKSHRKSLDMAESALKTIESDLHKRLPVNDILNKLRWINGNGLLPSANQKSLGFRGRQSYNEAANAYIDLLSKMGVYAHDDAVSNTKDTEQYQKYTYDYLPTTLNRLDSVGRTVRRLNSDILTEAAVDKHGDLVDKLKLRGLGYGVSAIGGAGLGALTAGAGNRLIGGGVGLALGVIANYLRRKSYYGDNIKW